MSWRLASSLTTLRNQVNAAYPNRSKVSDGTIGDAAHASSASDHNVNRNGVVCALDLTHDPANGFDAHALAEHLRVNRHPNLRYVISNARIAGYWNNWQWEKSSGHYQHCHISVGTHNVSDGQTYDNYDSTQAWDIGINKEETMSPYELNLLAQIAWNKPVTGSDKFVKDYTGKSVQGTLEDVLKSADNVNQRTKANNYEKQLKAKDQRIKELEAQISGKATPLQPGTYIVK